MVGKLVKRTCARVLAWTGRIAAGDKVVVFSDGTRLQFDGTPAPETTTYEAHPMNVADRLVVLTRQIGERPEVLGPRTVRIKEFTPGLRAALHILRQRIVELSQGRSLLVSTQAVAYRIISDPDFFICPVCYALAEDKDVASRTTHYPVMHGQLHQTERCDECGAIIMPKKGN